METRSRPRSVIDGIKQSASEFMNLGANASAITDDIRGIVQSEVDLAKAEMGQQVNRALQVSIWGATAVVFAYFMLLFLMVGAMFGLMEVVDQWIAALIVAGGALLLAGIAALIAWTRLKQIHLVPQRTIRSSKETITWARNQMRSNGASSSSAERQPQR